MKGRLKGKMAKLAELFPSTLNQFVFIAYMLFCVGQGVFVTASRKQGANYDYNTVAAVLLTEITKLVLAALCFFKDGSIKSFILGIKNNLKIFCLYLVPSFLYCIYNNLAFVSLSHFDPTTYFILLQLRVVITGIVFQIVFSKKLSRLQWFSLILLTAGCMVQQIDWNYILSLFSQNQVEEKNYFTFFFYLFFIIVQTLCSCFAGVYNEHLLKDTGSNVNIFIQNIFMYVDSILWNIIVLIYQGNVISVFSNESISAITKPIVIVVIVNNALVGITTSLFLKNLNSILKVYASAIELLFTAILSWIIFGIAVKMNTVIAIFIVSYSMYIYSQNPVNNRPKQVIPEDQQNLLEEA